jgi:glycosyltransferase involved in cell wall biosynthesis
MISIVIPCHNEAPYIENTYKKVKSKLNTMNVKYEIIIEQDGSTDGTEGIIKKISRKDKKVRTFSFEKRKGKGFGLKLGFKEAKGDVIMLDADLAAGPEAIENLLKAKGDIVIASGYKRELNARDTLSLLYRAFVFMFFGINLNYIQSGFKRINKKVLKTVKLNMDGLAIDTELVVKAKKYGYKVTEINARWNQKKKRSFGLLHVLEMFFSILRLRITG